jgi:hypothetical protein
VERLVNYRFPEAFNLESIGASTNYRLIAEVRVDPLHKLIAVVGSARGSYLRLAALHSEFRASTKLMVRELLNQMSPNFIKLVYFQVQCFLTWTIVATAFVEPFLPSQQSSFFPSFG